MFSLLRALSLAAALAIAPAAAASLVVSSPAAAQDMPGSLPQVELTGPMVEGFLATYPEIEALGEEFAREYGYVEADPEDPASFAMAYSRYADARQRMESVLSRHGIATMEQWAQIAYSVMIAYSFAEGGENIGGMDQEMAEAIAQIRNDQSIPADQREHLVAALEAQMDHIRQLRPSSGNIELAAQYASQIRAIVNDADED